MSYPKSDFSSFPKSVPGWNVPIPLFSSGVCFFVIFRLDPEIQEKRSPYNSVHLNILDYALRLPTHSVRGRLSALPSAPIFIGLRESGPRRQHRPIHFFQKNDPLSIFCLTFDDRGPSLTYNMMYTKRLAYLAVVGTGLILAGCQRALPLPDVDKPTDVSPIPAHTQQRRIAFDGGLFDLERANPYVAYPYWRFSVPNVRVGAYICNPTLTYRLSRSQRYWDEDDNLFGPWPAEAGTRIERALSQLGYDITEHRRSYFRDKYKRPRAELLLSLRITDMRLNVCHLFTPVLIQSQHQAGGNGVITAEWEVYDLIRRRVIGTFTTRGYGHVDDPVNGGDKAIFIRAVADAADNLGRRADFRRLITTTDPAALLPASAYTPLTLTNTARLSDKPIRDQFYRIRRAVLTVHADDVQGSGFFINTDGYALTAAEGVGDAQTVQITDTTGTKYAARVVRVDLRHHVALIKADVQDNMALPIAPTETLSPTDTVYAVGTPFENGYRATLTKGIIGTVRYSPGEDISLIQADITTGPGSAGGPLLDETGNVLGITLASGRTRDDTEPATTDETAFSRFIPITDALRALNLSLNH